MVLLELVVIVALGGGAQWLAWRLRLPSILLLLLFGFLAGPVLHLVDPGRLFGETLLLALVSLSVAVILFEGGLTLNFRELRTTGHVVRNLVLAGGLVTWLIAAAAAYLLLGLDRRLAVLAGAVLIVTGPTVIMPLLRHVRPTGPVGSILKWEGIVIDPLGALVTVLTFEVLFGGGQTPGPAHVAVAVLKTVLVGGGLGVLAAGVLTLAVARFLIPEFLHNAVALLLVCGVFALSNLAQPEAGLLAVTVMGIALANQRWADIKAIREFKENLRVFLISALFILLAARVRIADLRDLGWAGVALVAALILVGRPLSVWIATIGSKLKWQERLFLTCMAPRGIVAAAVASVFALKLEQAGIAEGRVLVPLVFTAIVGTVLVYGLMAAPVAQCLQLAEANPQGVLIVGAHRFARELARVLKQQKLRVLVVDTNRDEIATARMDEVPAYHGSILGEETLERLDLGGLGRLLALTPNDEVNILASQRFAPLFGRAAVYQLPPRGSGKARTAVEKHLPGRWLFSKDAGWDGLCRRLDAGAVVKATKLSTEFGYDAFQRKYGPDMLPLVVINEAGRLTVRTADQTADPKPGQTIISLVVDPDAAPAGAP